MRGRELRLLLAQELRVHLRDPVTLLLVLLGPAVILPLSLSSSKMLQQAGTGAYEDEVLLVAAPAEFGGWLEPDDLLEVVEGTYEDGDAAAEVVLFDEDDSAVILADSTSGRGRTALSRIKTVLKRQREHIREQRFAALGLPVGPDGVLAVEVRDWASDEQLAGRRIGALLPLILVLLVFSGGLHSALDVITGEKERSTLETLLTTRADRRTIVVAKTITVFLFCLFPGLLTLGTAFAAVKLGWLNLPDESLVVGWGALVGVAALMVPLSLQLAALLVVVAAYVSDYRQGQLASLPTMLLVTAPAAVVLFPNLELGPLLAVMPVAGMALAMRDLLGGEASAAMLVLVALASVGYAGLSLWAGSRLMGREAVVVGGVSTAGRRQRGNYVFDAVALFVVCALLMWFIGSMAQASDLVWGLTLSQVVLIAAPAVLLVVYLGLPLRRTLQLRVPRPLDLLWALAAGACLPAVASGVAELQQLVIPIPTSFLQSMDEMLITESLWVALLAFALLQAVCEEVMFRGAILGLLRRSLGPVAACVLVALLFGLLHMHVVRILPTAAVGLVATAAAWRSRSLAVPVLIHLVHNSLILLLARSSWLEQLEGPWVMAAASLTGLLVVVVAVALMGRGRAAGSNR